MVAGSLAPSPYPGPVTLRLYDTRSRMVRPFAPLVEGRAGVYVCGPTVQASPHVGHVRSAIVFDLLRRWLSASGLEVTLVRNITDVDDKIIHDASHDDLPFWQLAEAKAREFTAAYDALGVLPPTAEPRATGHMTEMVTLIAQLVEREHAYVSHGDVYLSVRSVPGYGGLSGQSIEALRASDKAVGYGLTGAKRDPLDFALWKAAKPDEPSWPAPWGAGRPGWHLECSAMAVRYLGESFDIHGGGLDLVFPHHENEIAQSTCAGHRFAGTWVHHGLVTVPGGEKMSKSLGNSTVVADVLASGVRPVVLRYYLGSPHYRSALDWTTTGLAEAESAYTRIETFVANAVTATGGSGEDADIGDDAKKAWADFGTAMDDDLSVPRALSVLHESVRRGNTALQSGEGGLAGWLAVVRRMLTILGLDPVTQWPSAAGGDLVPVVDALVAVALDARAAARARKDWAEADAVRDRLAAAGLVVEDTAAGVRWRLGAL